MIITYKQIHKIEFPVYMLPSDDWYMSDRILFFEGFVLDDKNVSGESLGQRRLKTEFNLYPLRRAVFDIIGILKQGTAHFIDNKGRVFTYQKTKTVSLKYRKIKKIDRKIKASVLYVHGEKTKFKLIRPPEAGMIWAGILYISGSPWKVYEFSETQKSDTWRKI